MERKLYVKQAVGALAVSTFLSVAPGIAQTQTGQSQSSQTQTDQTQRGNDRDTTRGELASFDQFLDGHREIAEQVRKNPSLVNNQQFVQSHPALQTYLQQHPNVRQEISENPNAFMRQENRYDRREDDRDRNNIEIPDADRGANRQDADNRQDARDNDRNRDNDRRDTDANRQDADNRQPPRNDERQNTQEPSRGQLARFDQFMDSHREISEQVKKNPDLLQDQQYIQEHPALQSFLQQNEDIRHQVSLHPNNFMEREDRYDMREDARTGDVDRHDRDRDMDNRQDARYRDRQEVASFDRFLDSHREEAEQLRRNPSLVNNQQFVQSHPALQAYLQQNPNVRQAVTQDPNAFMRQENQYDRREDMNRGHSMEAANFREFLGSHSNISQDLTRDPRKANDVNYQNTHPEFRSYLSSHPEVQTALNQNPDNFMKTVQQPATTPTTGTTGTTKPSTTTTPETKPPTKP